MKQFRMTADIERRLAFAAAREGMPQTAIVLLALKDYLTKLETAGDWDLSTARKRQKLASK